MPLSEAQIQRYARHILLPEVGGVGQERLLAAEVRARGERTWVELAGDYLSAAGVTVDAHSGPGLELTSGAFGVVVRVEGEALAVRTSRCPTCRGAPTGPLPLESGAITACLAASEMLALLLGLAETRAWTIRGAQVEGAALPCLHGGAA
jgi:hypothetical protein